MDLAQVPDVSKKNYGEGLLKEGPLPSPTEGAIVTDDRIRGVCLEIARVDKLYAANPCVEKTAEKFFTLIKSNQFLPSPAILSFGARQQPTLLTHVAIKLTDNFNSIFENLKTASLYLQNSIQVAIDFSNLRASRIKIGSSPKQSLGPVSFMDMFAHAAQAQQKTPLRFYLNIDHLNIEDFLEFMSKGPKYVRFAIGITDEFISCLREKRKFTLKHAPNSEASHHIDASPLYKKIMNLAISRNPIDFLFIDRIRSHQRKYGCAGTVINSLNQIVGENEMMAFGALNLLTLLSPDDHLDEEKITDVMARAIHLLDNCFELNFYPTPLGEKISKRTRRLCLTLMGLGVVLNRLNPEHSPKKSQTLLKEIFLTLQRAATKASLDLSLKRGGSHPSQMRHAAILGQVSTPFLCQLADTPNYLLQKSMTVADFYALLPTHACWQEMLANIVSFKTPIRAYDAPLFTKLFINACEQRALTFETGD